MARISNRNLAIVMLILVISMSSIAFDGMLHMKFYYTPLEAENYFRGLSIDQRMIQVWHGLLDCLYILSFSLLLYRLTHLRFVFIYTFVDYMETLTTMLVALGELEHPPIWLGLMTSLKWVTSTSFVIYALVKIVQKRSFLKRP